MDIAIALFVYDRPDHLKKTLDALNSNSNSDLFPLYFFCDGVKLGATQEQIDRIHAVQHIVSEFIGFKSIEIKKQDINIGLANSIISGVSSVLLEHDAVIVFEDDIISSEKTLDYLSEMLEVYKKNSNVISVTGYSYPEKTLPLPLSYNYQNYFLMRPCSWAWGTWRDRWLEVDWDLLKKNPISKQEFKDFNNACGNDVSRMLKKQINCKIDSWAIRFTYHAYLSDKLCSYPIESYVSNIGSDGTGTHRGLNADYVEHKELCSIDSNKELALPHVNPEIFEKFNDFVKKRYYMRRIFFEFRKIFFS